MHGFSQSVNEICLSRKNERWIFIPSSNCHGLVDPLFMGSLFLMNIISLITSVPNGMELGCKVHMYINKQQKVFMK